MKKILSLLLATLLVFGVASAFAEGKIGVAMPT